MDAPRTKDENSAASNGGKAVDGQAPQSPAALDLRTAHLWHLQPVRDVLVITIVVLTIYAGYAMRTVTVPLLVAFALAYLVEPVVARLARWRNIGRPMSVVAILGALGVVIGVGFAIVIPLAVGQTLSFAENLRSHKYDGAINRAIELVPEQYRDEAQGIVDRMVYLKTAGGDGTQEARPDAAAAEPAKGAEMPGGDGAKPAAPAASAEAATTQAQQPGAGADSGLFGALPSAVGEGVLGGPIVSILGAGSKQVYGFILTVLQLGLVAFLIPFYFYYFSVYWPSITGFFSQLVPDERKGTVFGIVSEMDRAVAGFVRGRIVICLLMGVMLAVGWQICGVPYGIALGLLTGAFSIVPYLGGVGVPIAVMLLIADQFGLPADERMAVWGMLLWPTLIFGVVQTIEGYLLTPMIAGKATNLDPVTIVVAILAGGSVAGVYGMLLAIPIAACGKIALKRVVMPRLIEFARGRVSDPLPIDGAIDEVKEKRDA
jgi:predicted PurR-regulated permease PerM